MTETKFERAWDNLLLAFDCVGKEASINILNGLIEFHRNNFTDTDPIKQIKLGVEDFFNKEQP